MYDLLPCPFCGEEVDIYRGDYVLCPDCGANMGFFDTDKAAIEAWNRRQSEPLVAELEEELRDAKMGYLRLADLCGEDVQCLQQHIDELKHRINVWKCAAKNHRWAFRGLCRISRGKLQEQHERIQELEARLKQCEGEL